MPSARRMIRNVSLVFLSSAGFLSMEPLRQRSRKASRFSIHNLISYIRSVRPLAGLAFSRGLAEQDAPEGSLHFMASFFPVDALDGSFGARRLSVVHTAPPRANHTPQSQDARNVTNEGRKACRYALRTEEASLRQVTFQTQKRPPRSHPSSRRAHSFCCAIRVLDSTPLVFQPAQIVSLLSA